MVSFDRASYCGAADVAAEGSGSYFDHDPSGWLRARLDSKVQLCEDGVAMSDEARSEFELEYFESEGEHYWKVTATGNHEVIAHSEQGFDSRSNARRNFELVQRALLSL